MKTVFVVTDNPIKFAEIADMLTLYGCRAVQATDRADSPNSELPPWADTVGTPAAVVREQTRLLELPGDRVEHESRLEVVHLNEAGFPSDQPVGVWVERVRGRLLKMSDDASGAYHWDTRFVPAGSTLSLHALKERGQKVSARQRVLGAWLQDWLHYAEPVTWRHMRPTENVGTWLAEQPLLQTPRTAPTRAIVARVHESGAWFKASDSRRVKHYWWPGLNAGIPMTPKKDLVHELTFLVHDLIHWAMPDTIPSARTARDHRLYVVTRMMSEAITLVMADMAFIDQALADGLSYDVSKRCIHPLYDPSVPLQDWCRAMSHYAIRGDDQRLRTLASSPTALERFQAKYAPFFEEDLRWTAHNARHLLHHLDPRWIDLHAQFASTCDLGFSSTRDYHPAWSEDDATLVDRVFDRLWAFHWSTDHGHTVVAIDPVLPSPLTASPGTAPTPAVRRWQRWWLGQVALTYRMDDLPLSKVVRDTIVGTCLNRPTEDALRSLEGLWSNYVDALEGLSRVSSNDVAVFRTHYPIVPPLYVSYDQAADRYQGIPAMWAQARRMA